MFLVYVQIPEDQDLIDFVVAQSSSSGLEEPEAALIHSSNLLLSKPCPYTYTGAHEAGDGDHHANYNNFQPPVGAVSPVSPSLVLESLNRNQIVPHEISVDRIEICNSSPNPINLLPPPSQAKLCGSESRSPRNNNLPAFDDGSNDTCILPIISSISLWSWTHLNPR